MNLRNLTTSKYFRRSSELYTLDQFRVIERIIRKLRLFSGQLDSAEIKISWDRKNFLINRPEWIEYSKVISFQQKS